MADSSAKHCQDVGCARISPCGMGNQDGKPTLTFSVPVFTSCTSKTDELQVFHRNIVSCIVSFRDQTCQLSTLDICISKDHHGFLF